MKKRDRKEKSRNKRAMTQLKAYFLIANMVIALVAFTWMVGAAGEGISLNPGESIYQDTVTGETRTLSAEGGLSSSSTGPVAAKAGTGSTMGITGLAGSLVAIAMFAGIGYIVGGFLGGNGATAGLMAGAAGALTYQIIAHPTYFGLGAGTSTTTAGALNTPLFGPMGWGIGVGIIVFLVMYKKTSTKVVTYDCLPYEAPRGGIDCEKCQDDKLKGCTEYRCKSLGQACQLLNAGTKQEACTWVNPRDVNSPVIEMIAVLNGYKYKPDTSVRPPATGVYISQTNGEDVEAFTPLSFTIHTDEPAQCKVDYNLTTKFDDMSYYVGGNNIFSYNHTEKMSLPSPESLNAVDPELKNDGTYTLYVRCIDANGNYNQDAYSVRFKVKAAPDTTPPSIVDTSVPSGSPIQYNQSSLNLEVYVNEPAECKWSTQDRTYDVMENTMVCNNNVWEMNNNNVYTCLTTLTGLQDRTENKFYFRCKDQPILEGTDKESDRNVNMQSYLYKVIGTQPLNILKVGPNETIKGSTNIIPVELTITTDNGYDNGKAFCYYSNSTIEKDYILFAETNNTNQHVQRQDLPSGNYKYYFKCVDLGGNAAYSNTSFAVESDKTAPEIIRAYKDGTLKIITDEDSTCTYSNKDCNFNIADGIPMPYDNENVHTAEWKLKTYYIRCKDGYDNQPNPNTCSVIITPYNFKEEVIEL